MGKALSVTRLAGALQAMDHDYFSYGRAGRALRMDEYPHAGLSVIKFNFHGETFGIHRTAPVIGCDG